VGEPAPRCKIIANKRIKEKEPAAFVNVFAWDYRIKDPDQILFRKQTHALNITRF
jgi:hypothetical protein